MASGCIVGECPMCGDWMFEDEWTLDRYENMVHERCLQSESNDKKMIYRLEQQLLKAEKRIQELEKQSKSRQLSLF